MAGGNRPPTVLNVAEKPSVARALASVFSRMPGVVDRGMRREEHQIFTHENVCFTNIFTQGHGRVIPNGQQSPHTMTTTSVRGHLASTDFPPEYGWNKVDPSTLFDAPIRVSYRQDMEPLERMIRNLASNSTAVILWLDCDREGEAIADEVREVCLRGNPRINVFRAKFSTVLPQEIQNALKSLGRINECWVQAVQSRMELDLRVGAAFTRFQTLRLQKKFDGFADNGVVSYGPCQFPTLGFVVER
jgi:DNA topoisomerase III